MGSAAMPKALGDVSVVGLSLQGIGKIGPKSTVLTVLSWHTWLPGGILWFAWFSFLTTCVVLPMHAYPLVVWGEPIAVADSFLGANKVAYGSYILIAVL
ncbi:hypothetical protein U1Q18_021036, partial [Sarracenia purpurea var. burkii]